MSSLRDYIMQYRDPKHNKLTEDEKLMIGSMIFEYLAPLLDDSYLLEIQFVQFLTDILLINKPEMFDILFHTMKVHFSCKKLKSLIPKIMSILTRKALEQKIIEPGVVDSENERFLHLRLIEVLV